MFSGVTSLLTDDDSLPVRRQRGRVTGALFASAAVLTWVATAVVPGWQLPHWWALTIAALVALVIGGATFVWARYATAVINNLMAMAASVLIALAQGLVGADHPAGMAVAMLYIWIAVVAALYYRPFVIVLQLVIAVAAQATVLAWEGAPSWAPQLLFTVGTYVVSASVVYLLATQLRGLSMTDSLTGLTNRRGATQTLEREITIATRRGTDLCVMVMDLDEFKQLNDLHGHAAGDRVLLASATAWSECLRPGDCLARTGGDEFLAVLPGCDDELGQAISQRLLGATPRDVTCSIGVATFDGTESAEALLNRADQAMYRAKTGGGEQITLFAV